MSEEIIPGAISQPETPDVLETANAETVVENAEPQVEAEASEEATPNFAEKTLAELSELFKELSEDVERMKKSKTAEAIKSAFYKKLSKEKAEAGLAPVEEPAEDAPVEEPVEEAAQEEYTNPFEAIEKGFKSLYMQYKRERAEFNKQLESEREDNLAKKQAVVEELKALVEAQEDVNATFPAFREIQNKWKAIGPVPATAFRALNDTYQFYVEKFYDMVKINRDLRDLDFKKNLEAKEEFVKAAEKLAEHENVVEAFHELQKLHEQWKEFGPVAKEFRDDIWNRFKAATAVVNKNYQAHFEGMKEKQAENLDLKTKLCEKLEEIAAKEVTSSNEWNALSKEIESIQAEWKKIGFASKKENQKIYERFRAACDKFFERKREFYNDFKDSMNGNLEKKMALIEQAESLKESTDWKKTTDQFINLQKQWKEIGAVPRKKSEQLWKRFRAACDEYFEKRDKEAKPAENDFRANLKAKKALIAEINAYELTGDDAQAMQDFAAKWQSIGFVPMKEKEAIGKAYKEAMQAKFPEYGGRRNNGAGRTSAPARQPKSEKDRLVQQYNKLQQDIDTYENNIGFFSASKNAESLIKQMMERIEEAKKELKELEDKIRKIEETSAE